MGFHVWTVYPLLVQRIAQLGYETIASTKRTFIWGIVFILPATLLFGGGPPSVQVRFHPVILLNLLFLGLVASAACFVTWGVAVKELGPAITATASILILREPLSVPIVCGIALTIAGLILSHE